MDWSWAIEGITEAMPRSTGPECANFLSTRRKIIESIVAISFWMLTLRWSMQRVHIVNINVPGNPHQQQFRHTSSQSSSRGATGKKLLLVVMTFILGLEMGFKLATKTMIFALNPCHITTIIQIYLLAAKPSKTTTALFRIQMNYLNGPLLAFVFPEAESRLLPMEATTYWIQHGLMFIIPIYLLRLGGPYHMEDIMDFKWNMIGYSLLMLYHFIVLQIFSVISSVNLNHMLCSALSDPFDGPNYRLCAVVHQAILCPFLCKLWCFLFTPTKNQIQLDVKIITKNSQTLYNEYDNQIINSTTSSSSIDNNSSSTVKNIVSGDQIMTTKID